MPAMKIPQSRLVKLNHEKSTENHAKYKVKLRKDSAWNAALALETSTIPELKLIVVDQRIYPLHLINVSANSFLLFFKKGVTRTHPGNLLGSERPNYIGPIYSKLELWAPIPLYAPNTYPDRLSLYELLDDLRNKRPNNFYAEDQLELAHDLIRRKAVVH